MTTKTDSNVLEQLDFDHTIMCQQGPDPDVEGCPNPAEWKGFSGCCGYVDIVCDECRLMILEWVNDGGYICGNCDFDASPGIFPWISVERLEQ